MKEKRTVKEWVNDHKKTIVSVAEGVAVGVGATVACGLAYKYNKESKLTDIVGSSIIKAGEDQVGFSMWQIDINGNRGPVHTAYWLNDDAKDIANNILTAAKTTCDDLSSMAGWR